MPGITIIVLMISLIGFFFLVHLRIYLAGRECFRVLGEISKLIDKDIEQGNDWRWRFAVFNEIGFNTMLFKFWKPVKSFYRDHWCLEDKEY